jgi:hypothetical protein
MDKHGYRDEEGRVTTINITTNLYIIAFLRKHDIEAFIYRMLRSRSYVASVSRDLLLGT